jgi:hypothetical protein
LSSRACHPRPRSRHRPRIGFTRSSTTAIEWPVAIRPASSCAHLPARSYLIDGDVACDEMGSPYS